MNKNSNYEFEKLEGMVAKYVISMILQTNVIKNEPISGFYNNF